jgi:hypothetical protein
MLVGGKQSPALADGCCFDRSKSSFVLVPPLTSFIMRTRVSRWTSRLSESPASLAASWCRRWEYALRSPALKCGMISHRFKPGVLSPSCRAAHETTSTG